MAAWNHRPGALLGLAILLAGCTAPASPDPGAVQDGGSLEPTGGADGAGGALPALLLAATGCVEGGGHSAHPKWDDYLPDPWEPADVQDDVGPVLLTSEWWAHPTQAVAEETMGNYHATVVCEAWTLDGRALDGHVFGFVGMKVEAPPFDAGPPADRHYLITVLATSDHGLHERFHAAGFHASLTAGVAEFPLPGVFHNVLDTEDHGVYESYFKTAEMGPMVGRMRLWWQMEDGEGAFRPVALDLANAGGTHLRGEAYGTFSHLETEDHPPLPGIAGEIYGLAYEGFDRTVTWGPRPDVVLAEAYIHS